MTDYLYLGWADLKTIVISLLTGIIGGLIVLGINRYWSNRSIKSLNRRIRQAEAQKILVEDLAKSERAVLLIGFQYLFALMAFVCVSFVVQVLILSLRASGLDLLDLAAILFWIIPTIISIYIASLMKNVSEHPKSLKIFETKIEKLRSNLRGRSGRQE